MRQENNKRKTVCVIGHFGGTKIFLDGQTIKTKTITEELERQLGADNVGKIDTYGGIKRYFSLSFQLLHSLKKFNNIVILPAQRGLRIIAPLLVFFNKFFHRRLFYCVIGGWLPIVLKNQKGLTNSLHKFDGIFVETQSMKKKLSEYGFTNIDIMPNCKKLPILNKNQLIYPKGVPYKLCTFSRVMKEKGVEDAVNAVILANKYLGGEVFSLDIYGQIDSTQAEWFSLLQESFPSYIQYGGEVPFDKSVECLKDYFALLFPTYYAGEGFAGTLLDAFAAGVPVIASAWKYNAEIVEDGKTGKLCKTKDVQSIIEILKWAYQNVDKWNMMKINCINIAHEYTPQNVIEILVDQIWRS